MTDRSTRLMTIKNRFRNSTTLDKLAEDLDIGMDYLLREFPRDPSEYVPELVDEVTSDILRGLTKNEIVKKLSHTKQTFYTKGINCPELIYKEAKLRVEILRREQENKEEKTEILEATGVKEASLTGEGKKDV